MSELTLLLAKVIGGLMVLAGLGLVTNTKYCKKLIEDLDKQALALRMAAVVAYILGALIVLNHNIWEANLNGFVTLLGWAALVKGAVLLVRPQLLTGMAKSCSKLLMPAGVVAVLVGAYVLYLSYMGV